MASAVELIREGVDVNIQDQTTPIVIGQMNQITNTTTITAPTVLGGYDITLTDATGIIVQVPGVVEGSYIILFSDTTSRIYVGRVVALNGLVISMDRSIDSVFDAGTPVDITKTNMNVDGSVTPQVFGLRGPSVPGQIDLEFDITRMMVGMLTTGSADLNTFGDITALTRGVLVRHRNGTTQNIFNWKSNGELATICYDLTIYSSTNPQQGQDGLNARLTFSGQDKIGVVVRLGPGEDIEVIIQDDLTAISRFGIVCEGHVVETSVI